MSGFVGSRAKKRNRNFFLIIGLLIIVAIFILIFPISETGNNQIVPNDNILPDPEEELTSFASNIEELELSLFQKDQKIKFRDGQIKDLQQQLKNLQSQYEVIILELNNIKDLPNNENLVSADKYDSLQKKINNLNIENNKLISKIKNLNKVIDDFNNSILLIEKKSNENNIESQKLKKDNKSLFSKNRKLENIISDLNNLIEKQKIEIESQFEKIKELKDKSHHGS